MVFAAGNSGFLRESTSVSPGNNPGSFAVGAVMSSGSIAGFSSRGPSALNAAAFYPQIVAPGVFVYTADLTVAFDSLLFGHRDVLCRAARSGAMALLAGAVPQATVAQLQAALEGGAVDWGLPVPITHTAMACWT